MVHVPLTETETDFLTVLKSHGTAQLNGRKGQGESGTWKELQFHSGPSLAARLTAFTVIMELLVFKATAELRESWSENTTSTMPHANSCKIQ